MDYGTMIGASFTYVKEGIIDNVNKWLLLIIATLILTIPLMGYIMNVYRGTKPAPEVEGWSKLFVDGILLFIVGIIYAIPVIILEFLTIGAAFATTMKSNPTALMTGLAGAGILAVILIIVAIIIGIISPIGIIRFARTGNFGEAFNFGEIIATIKKIGWLSYILALIIVAIVVGIPVLVLWVILIALTIALPLVGLVIAGIILLIVLPIIAVFEARYLTQVYESAGTA
ncbi:MAG: DUF4013 domain-containing protein [Methanoregula sp.]|jgi:hypothetical protein|uniref:DUF4013 domain-containing protein n=1 Tax=Methanoregula sp. TaxID=2052170 RepID=UPI003C1D8671